ncbi:MAG: CcdB family protein [Rhodoferax sp.]|nr:CcdB family protein [Rhodoferax sp.]
MPQYDVHRNTGKQRGAIPYVVVVQSGLFAAYRRRIVVPLVLRKANSAVRASRLNPFFTIEGIDLVLHPLEIVSIALDQLGETIGSLKEDGQAIADALDEVFTRSWD